MDAWTGGSDPVQVPERANAAADPGRAGLSSEAVPQLPRARRASAASAGRRSTRSPCDLTRRSTGPPGDPGRRQHAGVRKESESGGDHRAGGVSRDAASFGPGSGQRCFTRVRSAAVKRVFHSTRTCRALDCRCVAGRPPRSSHVDRAHGAASSPHAGGGSVDSAWERARLLARWHPQSRIVLACGQRSL